MASKDEYRLLSFDELDPEAQSCIPNSRDATCEKYQLERYYCRRLGNAELRGLGERITSSFDTS